ncbi:MAG: ribonuclease HIII [candidate division KSB1 bacterium]|nr:ribonuclease HIII [candidate division KSB1 bacterium]MDZ7335451.1 ribonuclease HIII [candidate division KSB1 bacterium]MDZ7358776.1 ribonuclease HIII [candidate division KSB1 bacterium]MDZ7400289.1 ribonuclease HIII [candidate division KSB1 bacterium]
MTLTIEQDKFERFKAYLQEQGYDFEPRPHQVFLAKSRTLVVNLYNNGKVVISGSNDAERKKVEAFLATLQAQHYQKEEKQYTSIQISGTRIGTDEAGKGDYFGPLVIAGVLANEAQADMLQKLGVKDSKRLSDGTIQNLAIQIKKLLGEKQFNIVIISPIKYNVLLSRMKNLNRLLGWGHARVIENLLIHHHGCQRAISDQFGDRSYIENALMKLGRRIQLIQMPKAEQEITVAAASILAKSESIYWFDVNSQKYGLVFPRGATNVISFAENLVAKFGAQALVNVAKVHFKTTDQIRNLTDAERKQMKLGELITTIDNENSFENA